MLLLRALTLTWIPLAVMGSNIPLKAPRPSYSRKGIKFTDAARWLFSGVADAELAQLRLALEAEGIHFSRPRYDEGTHFSHPRDDEPLPRDPFLRAIETRARVDWGREPNSMAFAAWVSEVLQQHLRPGGYLHLREIEQRYGRSATKFLDGVRTVAALSVVDGGSADHRIFWGAGTHALRELLTRLGQASAPRMRSLERLVRKRSRRKPLLGFHLAGLQHLLGAQGGLFRALIRAGIPAGDMTLTGKLYSESLQVAAELQRDGMTIIPARTSRALNSRATIDLQIAQLIAQIERTLAERPNARFLILDDGGQLIERLNERLPDRLASRIVAVEQTTHGIRELEKLQLRNELRFPVINVAESWAKRLFEPPMIARSLGNAIEQKLRKHRARGLEPGKKVLVLGEGTIGRALIRDLERRGFTVEGYDRSKKVRLEAAEEGIATFNTLEDALRRGGKIIVGVTGGLPLNSEVVTKHLQDGALLFNCGSLDTEFDPALKLTASQLPFSEDAWNQRRYREFQGAEIEIGDSMDPARRDLVLSLLDGRKTALLINGGGVVNFTGGPNAVPPRYIQLTMGLLYLGALQAAETTKPGIHKLKVSGQKDLVRTIQEELAESGESLESPTFGTAQEDG